MKFFKKVRPSIHASGGFSLVEIVVAIGLLGMISIAAASLLGQNTNYLEEDMQRKISDQIFGVFTKKWSVIVSASSVVARFMQRPVSINDQSYSCDCKELSDDKPFCNFKISSSSGSVSAGEMGTQGMSRFVHDDVFEKKTDRINKTEINFFSNKYVSFELDNFSLTNGEKITYNKYDIPKLRHEVFNQADYYVGYRVGREGAEELILMSSVLHKLTKKPVMFNSNINFYNGYFDNTKNKFEPYNTYQNNIDQNSQNSQNSQNVTLEGPHFRNDSGENNFEDYFYDENGRNSLLLAYANHIPRFEVFFLFNFGSIPYACKNQEDDIIEICRYDLCLAGVCNTKSVNIRNDDAIKGFLLRKYWFNLSFKNVSYPLSKVVDDAQLFNNNSIQIINGNARKNLIYSLSMALQEKLKTPNVVSAFLVKLVKIFEEVSNVERRAKRRIYKCQVNLDEGSCMEGTKRLLTVLPAHKPEEALRLFITRNIKSNYLSAFFHAPKKNCARQ